MYGLTLAYIVTFGGAIAALRNPLIGLSVYIGLGILRPQFIFGFAGDLSGLSMIVGVAVIIGWARKGFGSWRFDRGKPIVVALVLYTIWFSFSGLLALDTTRTWDPFIALLKLVVPLLVGITMIKDEKDWRPILWTIVLSQGYVGFEMNNDYLFKNWNTASYGFGGMDNNCFGVSLLVVLGPAIILAASSTKWWQRALAGVCAALILHTIMLTFSRGAMVGLLALGVTLFVVMPKRPAYIAALALAGLFALRFTGPELLARYMSTFASAEERDYSAESRLDLWRDSFNVANTYPVFGVGPANWRVIASSFGWTEGKSAHSVWIETAAELGYPGALLLLAFFGIAARRVWPIAREKKTLTTEYEVTVALAVVLSAVSFIVAGQFVSVPNLEVPYYVVMLGVAMLKTRGQRERPFVARTYTPPPRPAAALRPVPASAPLR